ncbi:MAG: undecaprenyl-diphosphate phosphatase [Spirochaetales bacterium]|nr:undecaprenyl-diphosphate phosphatase [Spirochaetales bacterium]
MSFLQGFILSVIQGIAEFLPISSSGHLLVVRNFMNLEDAPVIFDILLHFATLVVIVVVFRKRIWSLIKVLFELKNLKTDNDVKQRFNVVLFILLSTFITAVMGVFIDGLEISNPKIVYSLFIFTGSFLFVGKYLKGSVDFTKMGIKNSVLIGISQGIGVLPGVSRSGITITTGVFSGLSREAASEYSFIISIPAIVGAVVLKIGEAEALLDVVSLPVVIFSLIVTMFVGYFSLKLLLKLLNSGKFHYFSFYLIPLGILGLIWGK